MSRRLLAIALSLPIAVYAQRPGKQAEVKIQKTSLSRDQEAQLGKESAIQVEREMEVVHNAEIEHWLNQIGQNLAKTPQANAYPYYFKLVNDESINAFALPGGPMYVHTGLLKAADSEGEVAGVLAHEMSHVALRHGAAQMTKQQTYGTLFQVLGAAAGAITSQNGQCGMLCQISEAGAGLGQNSVLMKFSRGYEHDADLNGARMMSSAGYDPIQLPKFFEKLEATQGTAAEPKGLALWMASHPATGSRIKYVSDDIKFYPKRDYSSGTGTFPRVKQLIATIPPPKPQPGALILAKQGASPRSNLPSGMKDYPANGFAIGYPSAWQVGQPQPASSIYLIPQGGAVKGQNGGTELLFGAMIDYYVPQAGAAAVNLDSSTKEFVDALQKGDANLRAARPERAEVGGKPALMTKLNTKTSFQQDPDQTVYLYTVTRDAGLWYVALAAPPSRLGEFDPLFKQMIGTVQFPN
ncbi:MAG TPA: M48 family metallopeptidase [Bryobacteraceae bacterium]|nr:M48 family metallopeptidase [Bryobacteraceae bacterium]